ncbi:MAG: DMT family transporter [Chloroflexi bacterium]|nr:DMT family transporter [Chloroflexota bacterium]
MADEPRRPNDGQGLNVAVFVAIALIGGGNAVGVAIAVQELDPLWAAGTRFLAAGAIFAVLMAILRVPIPSGGALIGALIYGAFAFVGAFALLFWGLIETPPGTAQIIIALVPLLTLILAAAHRLERLTLRAIGGSLIALAGLAFLVGDRVSADVPLPSLLAVVGGAVFLAESGVVVKLTPRAHPVASNAVGMLGGGAALLVLSLLVGDAWVAPTETDTWAAMVFLVLGGSVAVFGLYLFLLGRWAASATSYTLLLMPIATVVYSALLLDEPLTPTLLLGGAVIIAGVWIGAFARTTLPRPAVEAGT